MPGLRNDRYNSKDGIETTLIEQIPEIRSVKDITDHSIDDNAFYPQEQES